MSKNNDDSSKVAALDDHRPLADSELDMVSGGLVPGLNNMIADNVGTMVSNIIGWW